jgi:uncharacterized protein (DUF1778 family)
MSNATKSRRCRSEAPLSRSRRFKARASRSSASRSRISTSRISTSRTARSSTSQAAASRTPRKTAPSPLMVRLDVEGKALLARAAGLRRISVSDYVRTVTVAQARSEIESARDRTIALTPGEQLAFWQALQAPPKLTPRQRRLGALMRGQA